MSGPVIGSDVEAGNVAVFSFKSRAGRLRYLARVGLSTLIAYLLLGAFVGAALLSGSQAPDAALAVVFAGYILFAIVAIVSGLMFAAQRLHDLNQTGWMSLLMLIPLVNLGLGLYLMFGRGTVGANDYGAAPPPNTPGVKLVAWSFVVLIFVVGILGAIAIPAYQDYVIRAQQSQQVQLNYK